MKLTITNLTDADRLEIANTINQTAESAFSKKHSIYYDGYVYYDAHCPRAGDYEGVMMDSDDIFGQRMEIIAKRLREDKLNPLLWYMFEEPLDGLVRMVCPFIDKEVYFGFDSEEDNPKSDKHSPLKLIDFQYSMLPIGEIGTTQDLIEAILLDQSGLY